LSDLSQRMKDALSGRYRIERELGRGGMATVFLAEDLKHGRRVAIKVLDPEVAAAIGPQRFLREIETVARLTHPHILPLHDSGVAGDSLFYVMPFVEGESLRDRLNREKQLPLEDALRIAREVADALGYAHGRGVVHRDIKPENVLLESGHAVVADFGIARATDVGGGATLTGAALTLGTPAYMSPEQAAGSHIVDGRSDEYSLGCVLYEMLAGVPPFVASTAENLVYQHLSVTPRSVTELRPMVPASVAAALTKALAKAPADRYATTAEFAAAIVAGAESGKHTAAEAEHDVPSVKPAGRHARWVAAVAASLLIAIVAVAIWRGRGPFSGWFGGQKSPLPASKNWILVADFDGSPEDPSLARAAREIVSAALDQSPVVGTLPRDQIQLALQQAGKPDTLRLTPQLAREIAYRGTVRTVLEGEVLRLGNRYSVTLRVADVEEDKQVVTLSEVAGSKDALIPVLTRLGGRIRARLGEHPDVALTMRGGEWSVATPSFDAYRRWSEGLRIFNEGDNAGALRLFREALALDPDFGVAWASLGFAYMGLGKSDSALFGFQEASRHPQSLTPPYRLLNDGRILWQRGDVRSAMEIFGRVTRLYPKTVEAGFAFNYQYGILLAQGRLQEAFEADTHSNEQEVYGSTQLSRQFRVSMLTLLGRLSEARTEAQGLHGAFRQQAEMSLALAGRNWARAESLATAFEGASGASTAVRMAAAGTLTRVAAARGEVGAAELHLRDAEKLQHEKGNPAMATRSPRTRIFLAVVSGRPVSGLEPWLERDTTTSALITRAFAAVASGDTARARHLLTQLRARSTTRLGAHGSTPEFIEAGIAARAGRWSDVVALIGQPAREGSDRGGTWPLDRIGTAPERWLVAQAYEKLGQPDSAAAFYLRMLEPAGSTFDPFTRLRLVALLARTGRIEKATHELAILERDLTRPDPDVGRKLDEARSAVRAASGVARPVAGGR
jgi:tetratricopeptide (TPR) repeat protein